MEILVLIAEHHYDTNSRLSLSDLGKVSRSLRNAVTPILWRRIICDTWWTFQIASEEEEDVLAGKHLQGDVPLSMYRHVK